MQTIRIIISGGRARSVEIMEAPKCKAGKDIPALLRSMPKALLAKALNIPTAREEEDNV